MSSKHPLTPATSEADAQSRPASKRIKKSFVACRRCHSHKIKCSGEQPCTKCQQTGYANECEYESRDRKVNVSQSYIDQLLSENERLRQQTPPAAESPREERPMMQVNDQSNQNLFLGNRAWFHPYDPIAPPIYIGEAACTAFATRFRRFLTDNECAAHMPRMEYVSEEELVIATQTGVPWPNFARAQLLVKKAMSHVGRVYHMMLRKSTLAALKEVYRTSQFDQSANTCKFFVLFALGEVYSVRTETSTGQNIPGMLYYARAIELMKVLPERPTITHIETLLLLSLFSYFLNRRHYAYLLVGNAMRLGVAIGLHHNIPEAQMIDPVERQHRVRIWWSIYIFDRMWGSKMGLPMSILEEDIYVDLPSDTFPKSEHDDQFSDTEYMIASIKLAHIAGDVITSIYRRKKSQQTFLQRVQKLLKTLKLWVETLPEHLRLTSDLVPKHIVSLHLSFNQCVILATRPTLLHVLTQLNQPESEPASHVKGNTVPQAALTLGEACIHAAQHSHTLIIREWMNGSLPVFGYFYAQYLFSTALILLMSSLKTPESSSSDTEMYEAAVEVLYFMKANGNLAALEFSRNLDRVRDCLNGFLARQGKPSILDTHSTGLAEGVANQTGISSFPPVPLSSYTPDNVGDDLALSARNTTADFTTGMAFLEPTMQAFLAQSDFDLGLLNHPVDISTSDNNSIYFWSNTLQ